MTASPYPIQESFTQAYREELGDDFRARAEARAEYRDPVLDFFGNRSLASILDEAYAAHYESRSRREGWESRSRREGLESRSQRRPGSGASY